VAFKVLDGPSIDTTSRTGKLIMGILALIAEFKMTSGVNDRWMALPRPKVEV
jgi:hypothetical protein